MTVSLYLILFLHPTCLSSRILFSLEKNMPLSPGLIPHRDNNSEPLTFQTDKKHYHQSLLVNETLYSNTGRNTT